MTEELLLVHRFHFYLASGARVDLLQEGDWARWTFEYTFREHDEERFVVLINETKLVVEYQDGLITDRIVLSMHAIFPGRLGKKHFLGVDISPGAKTYFEFVYERDGYMFRLASGQIGAQPIQRFDQGEGLARMPVLPFPLPDRIIAEFGTFRVPFKKDDGTMGHFEFPARTVRE